MDLRMNDFEVLGSYEDYIAQEDARGAALRVPDDSMKPVLYAEDIVRVEKQDADEGDLLCVQVDGKHVFGYRRGTVLERLNAADVPLVGTEHVVGVVTAVIDRDLLTRRR